jgi:hypothetical protein
MAALVDVVGEWAEPLGIRQGAQMVFTRRQLLALAEQHRAALEAGPRRSWEVVRALRALDEPDR